MHEEYVKIKKKSSVSKWKNIQGDLSIGMFLSNIGVYYKNEEDSIMKRTVCSNGANL